MKRLGLLSVLLLTACPDTGVVCRAGTTRCGNGCADFQTDSRNCGACGQACLSGQVCKSGACLCASGSTLCDGRCVVTKSDPKNCGTCGNSCGAGDVCENGSCKSDCSPGFTRCSGFSCISIDNDPDNCGACGVSCGALPCTGGKCGYAVIAACFTTGQVTGIDSSDDTRGPLQALGSNPISLASYGPVLLAADSIDNRLRQVALPGLTVLGGYNTLGAAPNQVLADPPNVYVVNSVSHTLQILRPVSDAGCPPVVQPDAGCAFVALDDGGSVAPQMADAGCFYPAATDAGCADTLLDDGGTGPYLFADAGCFVVPPVPAPPAMPCFQGVSDGGVALVTVGQLDTGANTFPQGAVKAAGALWVSLYGGFGADAVVGQRVLRIDVSNPAAPVTTATVDLRSLDLQKFDGGNPVARPYAPVADGTKVYVPLNNLNAFTYAPEGPGLMAVIDTATLDAGVINLGASTCLNPVGAVVENGRLYVSCAGAALYDSSFAVVGTDRAGVVSVNLSTNARAFWNPACPAGGDGGCLPVLPSRIAVKAGRLYLGDQNGGRIFVADIADGGFTERKGFSVGGPIQACGVDPMLGFSNVADLLALP